MHDYSDLNWDNIDSALLATDRGKLAYAMSKLAFEIYDMDGGGEIDYDKDNKNDFEIKTIDSSLKLKAGDFVARSGHVHFCMEDDNEDGNNDKKDNFGWGGVYREYPKNYTFVVESIGNNKYQIDGGGMKYNRVYRYNK